MEPLAVPTTIPTLNISNITGCIPVEKVIESMPYLVLKQDALNLATICFFAGFIIGLAGMWYWMTAREEDKRREAEHGSS